MEDKDHREPSAHNDNRPNSSSAYLRNAQAAVEAGDELLGIHLYLAAFERSLHEALMPSADVMEGMERAWHLAMQAKERSLAEHIFEKMDQFWTDEEAEAHADELQQLAFDKLEEFGFSPDELDQMADMFSMVPEGMQVLFDGFAEEGSEGLDTQELSAQMRDDAQNEPAVEYVEAVEIDDDPSADTTDQTNPADIDAAIDSAEIKLPSMEELGGLAQALMEDLSSKGALGNGATAHVIDLPLPKLGRSAEPQPKDRFNYSKLYGFSEPIKQMRRLGVGHENDESYKEFLKFLNERHGLDRPPSLGTIIFEGPSRFDNATFALATIGQLAMPAIRMRMERNAAGQCVLMVMASPDFKTNLSTLSRNGFEEPTLILLEDLDLWEVPEVDSYSGGDFLSMQMNRGAREAMAMIGAALDSPAVDILITTTDTDAIDPFFLEYVDEFTRIAVDLPTESERKELWRMLEDQHPSMRGLNLSKLVEYSASLSRHNIYDIALDSVNAAYRASVEAGAFKAVHTEDVYQALANYQQLDSCEYHQLEDYVAKRFKQSLDSVDSVDDLLS